MCVAHETINLYTGNQLCIGSDTNKYCLLWKFSIFTYIFIRYTDAYLATVLNVYSQALSNISPTVCIEAQRF